jgi:predicted DCC family thiol-disulfide oxidoreductase YuxK
MSKQSTQNYDNVIFFDGVCGLCNGFIDFVITLDKKEKFLFSPLQGEFAQKNLSMTMTTQLDSVVLLKGGESFQKSTAVIKIFHELGGFWKLASFGKIIPTPILDLCYDFIANNRYRIFGKKETCRLPTPAERARFII